MDTNRGRDNLDTERGIENVNSPGDTGGGGNGDPHATSAIVTRAEAQAAGLKRYFTGAPCANGHVAERMTSTFACLKCKNARELGRRSGKQRTRRNERRTARRDAAFAAATLTEITGIPHVVVETIDTNGKKTWQPAPKGQRT